MRLVTAKIFNKGIGGSLLNWLLWLVFFILAIIAVVFLINNFVK